MPRYVLSWAKAGEKAQWLDVWKLSSQHTSSFVMCRSASSSAWGGAGARCALCFALGATPFEALHIQANP
jgi:hypothetical protein